MSLMDLDSLAVGSMVWSRAVDTDGVSTRGGVVVDFGMHEEDGKPYVVHLEELTAKEVRVCVYWSGSKTPKTPHVARLGRLDLDQIEPSTVEAPNVTRMEGWAKKAMLGAVLLPWGKDNHLALIGAAGALLAAGKELTSSLKARQLEEQAAVNAELEQRLAERQGLAS